MHVFKSIIGLLKFLCYENQDGICILKISDNDTLQREVHGFWTWPLSSISKNTFRKVSVLIFRWKKWEAPVQLGLLERVLLHPEVES